MPATPCTIQSVLTSAHPGTTTPTRLGWGRSRSTATADAPFINWDLLTDAQVDCVWEHFGRGDSERTIASAHGVKQPKVHRHIARGVRRLAAAGIPELPAGTRRVPCCGVPEHGPTCSCGCDTPSLPCEVCIATLMEQGEIRRHAPRVVTGRKTANPLDDWFAGCAWGGGVRVENTSDPVAVAQAKSSEFPLVVNLEHHAKHHKGSTIGPHQKVNPYARTPGQQSGDPEDYETLQVAHETYRPAKW